MGLVSPPTVAQWCHDAGFRGSDLTTIVAIGMAENGGIANTDRPGGVWGVGGKAGDGPDQARTAKTVWDKSKKDGFTTGRNNGYLLFVAPAAAAASTISVMEVAPDVGGAVDTATQAAKSSAETTLRILRSLDDPIFWRAVIFIGLGQTVIAISAFVLLYRGALKPMGNRTLRAIGISDIRADQLADLNRNIVQPLRRLRNR